MRFVCKEACTHTLSTHPLVFPWTPPTPLSLLAGSSISHAWLPRAVQGNECKMPSWLKTRIISGGLRWAPQWLHATSLLIEALSLLYICHCFSLPHTWEFHLMKGKKTAFVLLILRFFYNQGCRAFLCWYGSHFIKPMCCVDLGT